MTDHLKNPLATSDLNFEGFEQLVKDLHQNCDNTELLDEADDFLLLAKTNLQIGGRVDLIALVAEIQASLSAFRNGEPITEDDIAHIIAVGRQIQTLLPEQKDQNSNLDHELSIDEVLEKIQAFLEPTAPSRTIPIAAGEDASLPTPEHHLSPRELFADEIERTIQEADIEIVSSPTTSSGHTKIAKDGATLQVLERKLRPGEVSLDDLERAFRETAVEVESSPVAPTAPAKTEARDETKAEGELVPQTLERELRPGEVSLDDLERAFRETAVEVESPPVAPVAPEPAKAVAPAKPAAKAALKKSIIENETAESDKIANQSIRVNVDTLEHLMTMVSELVLTRNQLLEISRRNEDTDFKVPLQRLSNVTAELQEGVMKTRMQPIGNAWQKLPRIVRDLSSELGKHIELEMHGADTELDRQVLDLIKDPLTHMVRNSADHGLESTIDRVAAGKPEQGTIRVSAYHEGGHIIICIADNGRGLNTERIKAKIVSNGLATEAELEKMTEAQIHKFIFAPGFSTAATVTSVSGRGVGMDVVRTNIDQIGGTIDVKSVPGEGSSFTIKIPLTLAIVSALIVEAAGERFAIPQIAVVELVRARANSEHRIERIKDTPVLRLRNRLLPLMHLKKLLKIDDGTSSDPENGFIVVTQVGNQTFGVVVDGVFHTEEIVVKPMSTKLRHIGMFSGNTIMGDGAVIMIVDPNGVAQSLGTSLATQSDVNLEGCATRINVIDQPVSLLVFRAGSQQPKAVPLALVTRLEEIAIDNIEFSNGRHMVQYRQQLMPLVQIEGVTLRESGVQPILVFADDGRSMGLVVDEIIDIVEEHLNIEVASSQEGILGSAVIKGQATEVIDVGHFLPMAFADWFSRKEIRPSVTAQSILLVDDSAFFRNMLAPVLKAAGYRVSVAQSAHEGLGLLRSGRDFDVVLTDIEMPEMNGFEFAEAIRADQRMGEMPIIALSSLISPAAIERGRQAGFYDYVAKFDRPGLIAALKEQTAEMNQAA